MKQMNILIIFILVTIMTSSIEASMKLKQFCFKDNIVQNKNISESNLITIHGLEKPALAKVKGRGGYMLNGRYMGKEKNIVKNGDHIRIHHEPLDEDGAKVSTTLIVSDVYDIFTTETIKEEKLELKDKVILSPCQNNR